jgi:type 1 glutamine amidotransferase
MASRNSVVPVTLAFSAAAWYAGTLGTMTAQQGGRESVGPAVFTAADVDKNGAITREEWKTAMARWFSDADAAKGGSITQDQLTAALTAALPLPAASPAATPPAATKAATCGGRGDLPRQGLPACPDDIAKMMAALPDKAPAKSQKPRKVLVLAKAAGYIHNSIPLAATTIEEMGKKTGAWTATTTYDAAQINADNLKQYDAIFLASTTGDFLDDPNDQAATAARRQALLDFVRGGKGLAGIHAAGDSYHGSGGAGGGGGRSSRGPAGTFAGQFLNQGDKNADRALTGDEMSALASLWFDRLDAKKTGTVAQTDFEQRFPGFVLNVGRQGRDNQVGTWPDFDRMIGGFFKFHWLDPQLITVKIDDPKSPLTAMFHGQEFDVRDEIYTYGMDTWSRENLRILTSIDYAKMSDEDKLKEDFPRADHDYGLSWIKRDGNGRVFYQALGHHERTYAMRPMLEHLLAGMQYALGDLQADDSPGVKRGTK